MIRAPFTVIQQRNTDPAQAVHTKWLLAGYGLKRLPVYHKFPRSKMALVWGYVNVWYLGSMMYHGVTSTWRQV